MEKPTFPKANLSDVRAIMAIMRVPVVELLCQAAMGNISILKYLLSDVHGCLWPCPIMPIIKYCRFPRTRVLWCLPVLGKPPGMTAGGLGM
jgi:hypothetical protein